VCVVFFFVFVLRAPLGFLFFFFLLNINIFFLGTCSKLMVREELIRS